MFEHKGIHTRLYHVIKNSGGYDFKLAIELLIKDYNIDYNKARVLSLQDNVRDIIKDYGIDETYKMILDSINDSKRNLMYTTLCFN